MGGPAPRKPLVALYPKLYTYICVPCLFLSGYLSVGLDFLMYHSCTSSLLPSALWLLRSAAVRPQGLGAAASSPSMCMVLILLFPLWVFQPCPLPVPPDWPKPFLYSSRALLLPVPPGTRRGAESLPFGYSLIACVSKTGVPARFKLTCSQKRLRALPVSAFLEGLGGQGVARRRANAVFLWAAPQKRISDSIEIGFFLFFFLMS